MAQLTKEQIEAIDNYGKEITSLKDFMEAVQKRPTMYLGSLGVKGRRNAAREIAQNNIDQILDPTSPADWFSFHIDERTQEIITEDNGKGLPPSEIIRTLTRQHTSKNYERRPGEYPTGYNGVGCKIVNGLSSIYVVESYKYDGTAVRMEFENGYPKFKEPKKIPNKQKKQGLKTWFIMNPEIMGDSVLEWKVMYHLIKLMISTLPIGTRCFFSAVDINGKEFSEEIVNKDGIITDLITKVRNPLNKPIVITNDDGYHKVEVAICYDTGNENESILDEPQITSFCNSCPTIAGTHIDGVLEGLTKWFTQYMNNIYLANQKAKEKLKIIPNDIKNGLNMFISGAHIEPLFNDQAKEILGNKDMVQFCKDSVIKGLDDWSKSNPTDLVKLCKFFKDMAEVRVKQEGSKAKIATKYTKSATSNLPAKYIRPLAKDHIELIIVEGDSALGTVQLGRDRQHQGIFPIRGKIINAFGTTKDRFFSNEEVQAITQIVFGQDYKRGLTVEDAKVEKVIFMADADVDGSHISALLLRMFVMYYPFLISAGMVYKAVPPLFSVKEGKKTKYFTEQIDIVKYVQKNFLSSNSIKVAKSKDDMSNKDITLFFMRNTDYIYHLEKIANTYAVDPYLLEMVLNHYVSNNKSIKYDKLKKEVNSAYRFMDVEKMKSTYVVKGSIDKSNIIIISDKFLNDCRYILDIIESNDYLMYKLNNKNSSIYNIMKVYEKSMPSNIQRYKGLGEMDKEELAESALYPGSNRTLVRYTLEDAKETIDTIRSYESDTKKILSLVGTVSREDLID